VLCGFSHRKQFLEATTVLSTGITFLASFWITSIVMKESVVSTPKGWFSLDALSVYMMLIVTGSSCVVALYSIGYFRSLVRRGNVDNKMLRLYYTLLNTFLFTMMLVLVSNNLGFLWIGTEATTLATAFLVAFYERESSIEAAWKYVIICSVGIALALFGIILTYYSALHVVASTANALNWSTLISVATKLDPDILKLAFVFIVVGFGTKAGLAPMHTWKPDAYSEAPAPISALMAAGLVNVAVYALLRFYILVHKAVGGSFAPTLFLLFGLVSIGITIPFILVQRDYKRLLAYSSVEHVGIIIFAFGLASPLAYFGGLLHVLNNAVGKLLLFLTAGNIRLAYDSKFIRRVTGAIKVVPVSATLFIIGIFAITGWPPFGVFISEFTIVYAGISADNILPVIFFIGFLAIIFIGFIYYGTGMVFGKPYRRIRKGDSSILSLILLSALATALLVLGVYIPQFLKDILDKVVIVVQG